MKIYANQLPQTLDKGLAGCYLLFGDEPFQIQDCRQQIKQHAKAAGFSEFIRLADDDQFDWQELQQHCQAMSLFADKKVIELELHSNKVAKAGADMLKQLAPDLDQDTILVLFGPKLDASQTKSAWFKALDKIGVYVPVYEIEGHHLSRWLQQQLKMLQLAMAPDAQQFLLDFTAGNLLATSQELQKLKMALPPNQTIDLTVIQGFVSDQARYSVFQLIDSIWAGKSELAMTILQRLKLEEFEPNIILWSLQKDLLLVQQLHSAIQAGQPVKAVFDQHRVWKNKQPTYQNAAARLSASQVAKATALVAQIDSAIKTFSQQCPYTMFGHVALLLAGQSNIEPVPLPLD